ncbi:peptide/nickel transport system ATP-binding protein [Okibacterium sp. HSC-33S16]|uniref:dipeptide ABC transporter ATP-binding protein n=1 Tax=Okibacterium sp. HSC-33S16 TaxID=2910965 RepID=UPI0020A00C40|nr:ABC transporter ATP-binding protein [Okibacterium sp. HSC-33S16]MCP2032355.1 peptide/nickel transport system ATP-binding protein [Okibacterium sp. HSC-33S16]
MTILDIDTEQRTNQLDSTPPVRLSVDNLNVGFERHGSVRPVVKNVSFDLREGQCVAIVGESGSGKSVTARTLVGLTGGNAVVDADALRLGDENLTALSPKRWRSIRGRRIGFILQDALVSLDPLRPVGKEIEEALKLHGWGDRTSRKRKVIDLLTSVGVPSPENRSRQRPDELSGGLRQRALIASALALDPEIVIADEPTTALDVTVQAQVLQLLEEMKQRGTSIILISHDLSVVAHLADHILVMSGGEVVEQGSAHEILTAPKHPYTQSLINAVPSRETRGTRLAPATGVAPVHTAAHANDEHAGFDGPVLEAEGLVKNFTAPDGTLTTAVNNVSFTLGRGETLGIVGESGSGKSTTARIALALDTADAGTVRLLGQDWSAVPETKRRRLRKQISVVYQDPLSSFDPRWNVERILLDSLPAGAFATATARRERVLALLAQVGLPDSVVHRFPLQLSGGQRQRVAIARALAPSPSIVVLDEAVSALDVSIQAQILDLLVDLQKEFGLSYLFISHDLGVISHLSDRVLVMKDGVVVESGDADQIFTRPAHPYTQELLGALPTLDESHTVAGASVSPSSSTEGQE